MNKLKRSLWVSFVLLFIGLTTSIFSSEAVSYRLLSISESEKLVLVSRIPEKTKYLLDASSAKITLNGKSVELKELRQFSNVQVVMRLGKKKKNAIDLDGSAIEIVISPQGKP